MYARHNILRLSVIKVAKWLMLYMPIVVPFYEKNGLTMQSIMILQGIYSVAIVAMEIPSGYLADVIGRRQTLTLGVTLGAIGFGVYCFGHGFTGFLIAEVILGIGQSFVSGADSALLYDSLLEDGRKGEYTRYEGRITSLGNLAEAVAGIAGGLLALISLRTPYIAQTLVAAVAIPAAFGLREPVRQTPMLKANFREILRITEFALFRNRELRRNIIFSSIVGAATLTMAWFAQPFFEHTGIALTWYGFLWTALNLTVAISAFIAYKLEERIGQKASVWIIALLIPGGYLALSGSSSVYGLILLFTFYIVRGFATPVLKDYINRITGSDIRATVLSVRNFIIRLLFAVIGPFAGYLKDQYSLSQAFLLSGIIFMVLCVITAFVYLASNENINRLTNYTSRTRPS